MARPAVAVEDLHKIYAGGVEAVCGLWFDVGEGEIFGLLGPNGAGKSTTLGMLTTVVRPTRGRAWVAGHDVRRPTEVRRSIGVVFQDTTLDMEFTARENLRLQARLWGYGRRDGEHRVEELLAAMDLAGRADVEVRASSGGMRRRLEIARALLARPRVLVLDEPTTGLDPTVRDAIWQLVGRLRHDEGVTIVLSTHYLEEAEGVCDRVAIIDRGRVVADGRPRDLVADLGDELVELRVRGDASGAALALDRLATRSHRVLRRGNLITLPVSSVADRGQLGSHLAAFQGDGLGVVAATIRRSTLADVFAHVTAADPSGDGAPAR